METSLNFKKTLAAVTVFLVAIAIFSPVAQAVSTTSSADIEKITEKIISEAPKFEELFPTAFADKSNDDKEYVQVINAPGIPTTNNIALTKEDRLSSACFPGYFTPNQISVQSDSNEEGGQMLLDSVDPIKTILILDEEMVSYYASIDPWNANWLLCCMWADNVLEGGDDYLEVPYGIDFQTEWDYISYWDSPDYMDYSHLLDEIDGVDPNGVGCDVIVLMSGQYGGSSGGHQILGVANQPGAHFVMDITIGSWPYPVANLFQHEASHLFDCSDHYWDQTYCIMSYTYQFQYRGYCTGCDTQLELNADQFN